MPKSRFAMYAPFLVLALVQAIFVAAFPSTGDGPCGRHDRLRHRPVRRRGRAAPAPAAATARAPGGRRARGIPGSTGAGAGRDRRRCGRRRRRRGRRRGRRRRRRSRSEAAAAPAAAAEGDTSHCAGERQMNVFAVDFENPPVQAEVARGRRQRRRDLDRRHRRHHQGRHHRAGAQRAGRRHPQVPGPGDHARGSRGRPRSPPPASSTSTTRPTAARWSSSASRPAARPSPADVPTCIADARKVIEKQPFAVFFAQPSYPELFEEFTRAGILTIGGWHFDKELFAGRRPFRWDIFVDGTDSAEFIAEYYCKKLQGKAASNAGALIHPQVGGRDTAAPPRHRRARPPGQQEHRRPGGRPGEGVRRQPRSSTRTRTTSTGPRSRPTASSRAWSAKASPRSCACATRSSRCSSPPPPRRPATSPSTCCPGSASSTPTSSAASTPGSSGSTPSARATSPTPGPSPTSRSPASSRTRAWARRATPATCRGCTTRCSPRWCTTPART